MPNTALIIEVPDAELLVHEWRALHDPVANNGTPAHITVLYPFVELGLLDDALSPLSAVLSSCAPFAFTLTRVDEFPGAIWLRPEPDEAFRTLTKKIWSRFPDYPPYGGRHPDSQPHLTIALSDATDNQAELMSAITSALAGQLPLEITATALSVFVSDDDGTWQRLASLPLGG